MNCTNSLVEQFDPTIEGIHQKLIQLDENSSLRLDILDTAGMEEFSVMWPQQIRESEGYMLVFACDGQRTVTDIQVFLDLISEEVKKPLVDVPIVLAGNRCDLDQYYNFDMQEVQQMADMIGAPLIFTSARQNININKAFEELAKVVLTKRQLET